MNPWNTNFLLLAIASQESGVGTSKVRQWVGPMFISVVCDLYSCNFMAGRDSTLANFWF